jgi:hypothetical protein
MLHTSGGAHHGKLEVLLNVGSAGPIGIRSLYDSDMEILLEASGSHKVPNERSVQSRDAVTIEHEEASIRIDPVVDEAVGIAIEGAAAGTGDGFGVWWGSLFGLDEIGATLCTCQ